MTDRMTKGRNGDAGALQVRRDDDEELNQGDDGQKDGQDAVLLQAAVDAGRDLAEKEARDAGVLMGAVLLGGEGAFLTGVGAHWVGASWNLTD